MSYQPKRRWLCADPTKDEFANGSETYCRYGRHGQHSVACGWKVIIDADSWRPNTAAPPPEKCAYCLGTKFIFDEETGDIVGCGYCDETGLAICGTALPLPLTFGMTGDDVELLRERAIEFATKFFATDQVEVEIQVRPLLLGGEIKSYAIEAAAKTVQKAPDQVGEPG